MPEPATQLVVHARGEFDLSASARFLEAFTPARHAGATAERHLHIAFPAEPSWTATAVCVRPHACGFVADTHGGDAGRDGVHDHLARIFSLDVDGTAFGEVGERDTVIGELQRDCPGLRPVCFWSPYEAACWAVLSHRIRMTQASALKQRITQRHGTAHNLHGDTVLAFPSPQALLDALPKLDIPATRARRLAGIAEAALDGDLKASRLRAMEPAAALEQLQTLRGIGPFSAELILLRGAGAPDVTPRHERRLLEAVGGLYRIAQPKVADLDTISERWVPYRTWCAVLIRVWAENHAT